MGVCFDNVYNVIVIFAAQFDAFSILKVRVVFITESTDWK